MGAFVSKLDWSQIVSGVVVILGILASVMSQFAEPNDMDFYYFLARMGILPMNHSAMLRKIDGCQTIQHFLDIYQSDPFYKNCVGNIERMFCDLEENEDCEGRAKRWAEDLYQGDLEATNLNDDRKVCLHLLYAMCNRWKPKPHEKSASVTKADIIHVFKPQRFERILYKCMVMDRANALYNMQDHEQRGMDWYAEEDSHLIATMRKQAGSTRINRPTINRRLVWLIGLIRLSENTPSEVWMKLNDLLTPQLAPNFSHNHKQRAGGVHNDFGTPQ